MVELINRARSNPEAEAALYGIDLNDGLSAGTISSSSKQPLAPHQALVNAAGAHSQDMLDNDYFSHTSLSGESPTDRALAAGYPSSVGENIAWGGSTAPIDQDAHVYYRHEDLFLSPGHRRNMLLENYREIGAGVRYGVFTVGGFDYNASMVTENFGNRGGDTFITGVVFADVIVADNFYTIGEGTGNITISALSQGTGITYIETTGPSGGYSIQLPAGTYTVTASGGSISPIVVSDVVVGTENVKVDFDTSIPAIPPGSDMQIIDDGEGGFTTTGSWSSSGLGGFGGDSRFASSSSANQATWTFQVTPGRYRVSASWVNHPNRASDSPFTVFDGSTALATVDINQEQAPNDLNDQGAWWEDLGPSFDILGNTLRVQLTGSANDWVGADAVRIERLGDVVMAPEIEVLDGVTVVNDGGTINFGTTAPNVAVDKQLTVRNVGTADLTLTPLSGGNLPVGYAVVADFGSTTLAPGASTTFIIRLQSGAVGTFGGSLSFDNDDGDENPFDLALNGTVASAPTAVIVDDGDVGFTTTGSWSSSGLGGFGGDSRFASSSSANRATWTFQVTPGRYRVSASWVNHANRASDAPFTVFDGSTALATVDFNQEQAPNDLNDQGVWWEDLGQSFDILGNTLRVQLTGSANDWVGADAVRIERLGDVVMAPEIEVLDGVTVVSDGGTINFGTTLINVGVEKQLTVRNVGTADLTLTPLSGSNFPAGYALVADFGSTILAPNASTTFTIRLQSGIEGPVAGALSFGNNDGDEHPFDLSLAGTVASASIVDIIDDGDAGFTTTGSWSSSGLGGFGGDSRFASRSSANQATWTFQVTPGRYRVSASWVNHANRASDAPFTVFDGSAALGTVDINQEQAPNDLNDQGAWWEDLGQSFDILGNTLRVQLTGSANDWVGADAVRIERIGDVVTAPEIEVLDGSTVVNDGGTVNFGTTLPDVAVDKELTVRNAGTADLTLTPLGAGSLPAGYVLLNNFASTTLAPGASTTFTIRLQSGVVGSFSGPISFANDDGDENPFNLSLSGEVANAPAVEIIDDGDGGFATTGSWGVSGLGGHQGDSLFASANPANQAAWTFQVTPGRYRVSATWSNHANRASDAPFTIRDGSHPLATVDINQEQAPNGFSDAGTTWQDLGGPYDITGTVLVVHLSGAANGYVVADAIRIERL